MGKKERIQVQLSAETLVLARSKTELRGLSMSGYIRGLIMADLGGLAIVGDNDKPEVIEMRDGTIVELPKKKSNPTDDSFKAVGELPSAGGLSASDLQSMVDKLKKKDKG